MGVSIGSGVLFAYELIRYLMAANEVIPKKARYTYNFELEKESLLLNETVYRLQSGEKTDTDVKLDSNNEESKFVEINEKK